MKQAWNYSIGACAYSESEKQKATEMLGGVGLGCFHLPGLQDLSARMFTYAKIL